jgi:hypothetical protein
MIAHFLWPPVRNLAVAEISPTVAEIPILQKFGVLSVNLSKARER